MELNKIFASVLLAGIIAMAAGFIADLLVAPEQPALSELQIDTESGPAAPAEEEPEGLPDVRPLLASADPSAGESLTRACTTCHTFEEGGPNRVGPNLWGVVGGAMAHAADFNYSSAVQSRADEGGEWTFENLNAFIENPRGYLPGTNMSYAGMGDAEDRANLIAWMNEQSSDPLPLPSADEVEAESADDAESGEGEAEDAGGGETDASETNDGAEGSEAEDPGSDETEVQNNG
ncbi:c-type cytochrome [Fodinicurvata sp. EGI_FJ10296]|uniref:c-type cytochrome n=1 Tax=Fodinicurvata sp. EGI_FJ10296 TaxID=3231908 RepID=UPI0034544A61